MLKAWNKDVIWCCFKVFLRAVNETSYIFTFNIHIYRHVQDQKAIEMEGLKDG